MPETGAKTIREEKIDEKRILECVRRLWLEHNIRCYVNISYDVTYCGVYYTKEGEVDRYEYLKRIEIEPNTNNLTKMKTALDILHDCLGDFKPFVETGNGGLTITLHDCRVIHVKRT